MAEQNVIASAQVIIGADTSALDKATRGMAETVIAAEKKIRAELARTEAARKVAMANLAAGTSGAVAELVKLTAEQDKLNRKLEATVVVARKVAGTIQSANIKDVGGGKGGGGRKMNLLDAGRIIDDLQYVGQNGQGLRPILNNLTEFAPLLGVAALGVDLLVRHWDSLSAAFGKTKLGTQAEEMAKLADATERTAEQTRKLAEYEERESGIAAQRKAKTKEHEERAEGVKKAITEGGYTGIIKGLTESASGELISTDSDARNAADALAKRKEELKTTTTAGGYGGAGGTRRRTDAEYAKAIADDKGIKALETALNATLVKAAENLIQEAKTSPEKLKALINKVEANPGAYPKGFGDELKEYTPEGIKAKEAKAARILRDEIEIEQEAESNAIDAAQAEKAKKEAEEAAKFEEPDNEANYKEAIKREQIKKAAMGRRLTEEMRPQVMGTSQYLQSIQTAGASKEDQIKAELQKQLDAVKEQTKILEDIKKAVEKAPTMRDKFRRVK